MHFQFHHTVCNLQVMSLSALTRNNSSHKISLLTQLSKCQHNIFSYARKLDFQISQRFQSYAIPTTHINSSSKTFDPVFYFYCPQ